MNRTTTSLPPSDYEARSQRIAFHETLLPSNMNSVGTAKKRPVNEAVKKQPRENKEPESLSKSVTNTAPSFKLARPKRALSAYNFFFSHERARILGEPLTELSTVRDATRRPHRKSHGKISFKELARIIGERWKKADSKTREICEMKAAQDMERYRKAMDDYNMAKTRMLASGVFDNLEDARSSGNFNRTPKLTHPMPSAIAQSEMDAAMVLATWKAQAPPLLNSSTRAPGITPDSVASGMDGRILDGKRRKIGERHLPNFQYTPTVHARVNAASAHMNGKAAF